MNHCKYCGRPCVMSMCKWCYEEFHEREAELEDTPDLPQEAI